MGFRNNKRCTNAKFTLNQLAENAIEYDQNLCLAFMDQEKAYDRANRE